ncbi:MAG: hypothetical protein H6722_10505 [Sandaracinus sp.]|nr:hypothetical protein [Sandaracinus sp.]MCB9621551.1 hypothetical protein [Sandaracinus sp.]
MGTLPAFAACDPAVGIAECGPGLVCNTNRCLPWCRVGSSDCAPYGTVCARFSTPVVLEGVELGVCAPPA